MKRIWMLIGTMMAILTLTGCAGSGTEVWETVADGQAVLAVSPRYDVVLPAPDDAILAETFSREGSQVYTQTQGDYTITVDVLQAGSLSEMLKTLSGLDPERLTVMTTWQDGMPRYDLTWSCAGETELMVCRSAVIDDGSHYYTVTVAIPESLTGEYGKVAETCLAGLTLTEKAGEPVTAP